MIDTERVALAGRLKEARLRTAANRRTEISQEDMAGVVARALGRALHPTQWRRYESGKSEPPLAVIRAVATVSGLAPAYVAFGPEVAVEAADYFLAVPKSTARSEEETVRPPRAAAKGRPSSARGQRRRGS